jgi:hypothetical protein
MTKVRELKPQENLAGLSGGSGGNSADDPGAPLLLLATNQSTRVASL